MEMSSFEKIAPKYFQYVTTAVNKGVCHQHANLIMKFFFFFLQSKEPSGQVAVVLSDLYCTELISTRS